MHSLLECENLSLIDTFYNCEAVYVTDQNGQYLLVVGLDHYKCYQSQTPGHVPTRTLGLQGGGL